VCVVARASEAYVQPLGHWMKVAATAPRRVAGLYEWLRRTDNVVRCIPPLVDELCVALGLPVADMYVQCC
jgi:hypothetical protein